MSRLTLACTRQPLFSAGLLLSASRGFASIIRLALVMATCCALASLLGLRVKQQTLGGLGNKAPLDYPTDEVFLVDDQLRRRVSAILSLIRSENWDDHSYSLRKACICVELSALVYHDVQEYELKKASRIHLFASDAFREVVKTGKSVDLLASLAQVESNEHFFLVRGRYAVVLGVVTSNVVLLAVRGTAIFELWDWKANIDARKFNVSLVPHPLYEFSPHVEDSFFHRGFFEAIVPTLPSIAHEIQKRSGKEPKIVWTGHSLGGAMAAIGYAMSSGFFARRAWTTRLTGDVVCAYTFGMPRYCGLGVICTLPGPYHVYKRQDLVPSVPLRRMGFSDSAQEFEITKSGVVAPSERTDTLDFAGHLPKVLSSIKAHSVEGYAQSLFEAAQLPRP